ncbi:MAG: MBL fold metallo-hydrolase [Chloroflexi bacterium]|nr:MBL fold metallo-hydrolase [Chloroflexota bacterium]
MPTVEVLAQGFMTATSEGGLGYCSVNLIRGEQLTLVDVGYQNRRELVEARLAAIGVRPEEITRIVLTHAHWDHSLNLAYFPNAEVFINADEYEYSQQPHPGDWATPAYIGDMINRAKKITKLRDGDELEPGVRVMAVPGHSPGSQAVLVESAEGIVGLVGDALPGRAAALLPTPTARIVFWDEAEAERAQAAGHRVAGVPGARPPVPEQRPRLRLSLPAVHLAAEPAA